MFVCIDFTGTDWKQFPRTVTVGVSDFDGHAQAGALGHRKSVCPQEPDIFDSAELTMAGTQEVPSLDRPPRCHFTQVRTFYKVSSK